MGVSLRPSQATRRPDPSEEAADLLETIRRLRDDDRYRFADETLMGIQATVQTTGQVSEAQARAVGNIEAGAFGGPRARANGAGATRGFDQMAPLGTVVWIVVYTNGEVESVWLLSKSAATRAKKINGTVLEIEVSYGDGT